MVEQPFTWEPTRWYQVTAPDGSVWAETSDEADARRRMRPGDTLWRQWRWVEVEWREVDASAQVAVHPMSSAD
jgi:hypothetical protein